MTAGVTADRFDELFRTAAHNASSQLKSDTVLMRRLRSLHAAFDLLTQNLNEPSSRFSAVFAIDVHARFLGACLLCPLGTAARGLSAAAFGARVGDVWPSLEDDTELCGAWFNREASEEDRRTVRQALGSKDRLLSAVRRRSSRLATAIDAQYKESIALGAHQDPMAVAAGPPRATIASPKSSDLRSKSPGCHTSRQPP